MQKNLSDIKHLRLTSSDENLKSDFFQRDEGTDAKIILIKKEGFEQQIGPKLTRNFSFSKH